MKFLVSFLISILFSLQINSQDKKEIANVYFKRAQKSYEKKDLEKTTDYLEKTEKYYEGIVKEDVAVFGAKYYSESKNFEKSQEYLKAFFSIQNNKTTDLYKEMLLLYTNNLDALENPENNKTLREETKRKDSLKISYKKAIENYKAENYAKTVNEITKYIALKPSVNSKEFKELSKILDKVNAKLSKKKDSTFVKKELLNSNNEAIADETASFLIIEDVPVFPGCKGDIKELKNCFSKSVQQYFIKHFDADLPNKLGLSSGKKKVLITFKIDKTGNIVDVDARAPHAKIKEEAIRVIKLMPKMLPGKQKGKPVGVKYSIPFTMIVDGAEKE